MPPIMMPSPTAPSISDAPVVTVRAVDACATRVRHSILSGELPPGERLPPERELARHFGVNRVTVRAALSRLAAERLVSVRQGSGHVVLDFRQRGGPELLPGLSELTNAEQDFVEIARDLLLARRCLARAVLERVIERGAPAIVEVRAAVDRFEQAASSGADSRALAVADAGVVSALLDASGSRALRLCLNPVFSVVEELPELRDALYVDPPSNVAGYRALVGWLESGRDDLIELAVAALATRDATTIERLEQRRGAARRARRKAS